MGKRCPADPAVRQLEAGLLAVQLAVKTAVGIWEGGQVEAVDLVVAAAQTDSD